MSTLAVVKQETKKLEMAYDPVLLRRLATSLQAASVYPIVIVILN